MKPPVCALSFFQQQIFSLMSVFLLVVYSLCVPCTMDGIDVTSTHGVIYFFFFSSLSKCFGIINNNNLP